jgi:hypothetical protein
MEVVSRVVWCGGAGREQHGRGCAASARARARARATPVPVPVPVPEPVSAHARREGSGQGAVDGRRGWHAGVGPWDLGTQQRAGGREPPSCSAAMITQSRLHEHANPHSESRSMPPRCPLQHDAPPECHVHAPRTCAQWARGGKIVQADKKRTTSIRHPTKPPSPKPSFCRSVACNQGVQSMIHPFNGRLSGTN